MAVISKGITLSYKNGTSAEKVLTNLQSIPDLGGSVEALEITVLSDEAHTYTSGIKSYGDSLTFTFLYEEEQFAELNALTSSVEWKVSLPDGESFKFSGKGSCTLAGVGVNAVLTYNLAIQPESAMEFTASV